MPTRKEDVYYGLVVETYNLFHPEGNLEDVPFYRLLIDEVGGPVLEMMCGSGRVLLPLLRQGIEIDGVDCSADMLASCRERLRKDGLKSNLFEQYAQELELPRRYRTILFPYGSFALLTNREEALETLRRLYDHLEPGGQLVLDIAARIAEESGTEGTWQLMRDGTLEDGRRIQIDCYSTIDQNGEVLTTRLRYSVFKGASLVDTLYHELVLRQYRSSELEALLETAGFVAIDTFTNFNRETESDDIGMISHRARRPA
jgi:SAM-dependent methyltransferase